MLQISTEPGRVRPSMKVPPKRKGNKQEYGTAKLVPAPLNESPSEKEGKYAD